LLLASHLDHALTLGPGLCQELLAILHDPAGLLDLLRQALLHRLDHPEDLVAVHQDRGRQRHRFGVADERLELQQASGQIHQPSPSRSTRALRTWSGTSPSTSPPSRATSFTREEERNDHLGLVGMNNVSTDPIR